MMGSNINSKSYSKLCFCLEIKAETFTYNHKFRPIFLIMFSLFNLSTCQGKKKMLDRISNMAQNIRKFREICDLTKYMCAENVQLSVEHRPHNSFQYLRNPVRYISNNLGDDKCRLPPFA